MIAHAEQSYGRFQEETLARLRGALPGAEAPVDEQARIDRFCTNIARLTRPYGQEPSHFHYPGLPPVEFHDRSHFPWLAELEAATAAIREEFDALIATEAAELVPYIQYPDDVPLRQWEALNRSRDWTAVHLLQNGRRVERNARHCPHTMALLERLPQPDVPGASPNAMFSLLAPRTRIPPHTGVANTRLVCHLPLIVPQGCGFRVGAETRAWQPGTAFVFDDTIEHEAWNDSARASGRVHLRPLGLGAERGGAPRRRRHHAAQRRRRRGGPVSDLALAIGRVNPADVTSAYNAAPRRPAPRPRAGRAEAARGGAALRPRRRPAVAGRRPAPSPARRARVRHRGCWPRRPGWRPRDPLIAHTFARAHLEAGLPSVELFEAARRLAPEDARGPARAGRGGRGRGRPGGGDRDVLELLVADIPAGSRASRY